MRQHFGLRDIDSVLTWFGRKMKADSCSQLHREGWGLVAHKSSFRLKVKGGGHAVHPSSLDTQSLKNSWEQK